PRPPLFPYHDALPISPSVASDTNVAPADGPYVPTDHVTSTAASGAGAGPSTSPIGMFGSARCSASGGVCASSRIRGPTTPSRHRSEEHTSELQSPYDL